MPRIFPAPIIGQSAASGAQVIDGSLKFEDTPKHHLLRTHTAGNTKTFTWAGWVKRDKYGGYQTIFGHVSGGSGQHYIDFGSDKIRFTRYVSSNEAALETTAKFRDTGWYHIVAVWDTTNSTANDRLRLYVNGEQITDFSTRVNPSQNYSGVINTAIEHGICRIPTLDQNYHACRMSQVYFMDGLALEPENFGFTDPLTNIWKPKKYTGDFNGPADLKSEDGTFTATGNQVGGPIANAYDGNIGEQDGSTSGITFWGRSGGTATQSGLSIPVTSTVKIRYNVNVGGGTITVNSVSKNANVPGGGNTSLETLEWDAFSVGYSISSIAITSPNLGVGVYVSGIIVDGVVLEDIPAGTNGFYLPFDGNSPIGQDKSGNGNDWTPVNFGGSEALDNPNVSGARPILNTTQGGTQAGVGVFGSLENKYYTVTTANGSVYQFDITSGDNPSLEFIRGATYRFDYTSHASHPLRFSSTNPDSSTTAYTTGTNTSVSNVITITVPHDAPDTLYYYCTAHASAMNGAITVTTDNTKADQYASSCVLALPLVGSTGDVCASIACTSTAKAITSNGTVAASNIESNIYSGSFLFDGDSDYFTFAPGADFAFGTADFTVECWCYSKTRDTYDYIIDGRNSGQTTGTWTIAYGYAGGNGRLEFASGSSTLLECPAVHNPEAGRWFHVAVARSGTSLKMFIDGVEVTSATNSTDFSTSPSTSYIGTRYSQQHYWDGYMQDIRVYKGVAKYTSDFVVPATSPDILPDTPSGVSGGSKLTKITDGAVNIVKASTSYLDVAASSDFRLDGEFCIEYFVKLNDFSNDSVYARTFVLDGATGDGGSNNIHLNVNPSTGNVLFWNGSSERIAGTIPISGGWHHVALTRDSSNDIRLFVDGRISGTDSSNTTDFNPNGGSPRPRLGGLITGNKMVELMELSLIGV